MIDKWRWAYKKLDMLYFLDTKKSGWILPSLLYLFHLKKLFVYGLKISRLMVFNKNNRLFSWLQFKRWQNSLLIVKERAFPRSVNALWSKSKYHFLRPAAHANSKPYGGHKYITWVQSWLQKNCWWWKLWT